MEDTTQLFLRLFTQIREFVILARQFYIIDIESEDTVEQTYYLICTYISIMLMLYFFMILSFSID